MNKNNKLPLRRGLHIHAPPRLQINETYKVKNIRKYGHKKEKEKQKEKTSINTETIPYSYELKPPPPPPPPTFISHT